MGILEEILRVHPSAEGRDERGKRGEDTHIDSVELLSRQTAARAAVGRGGREDVSEREPLKVLRRGFIYVPGGNMKSYV